MKWIVPIPWRNPIKVIREHPADSLNVRLPYFPQKLSKLIPLNMKLLLIVPYSPFPFPKINHLCFINCFNSSLLLNLQLDQPWDISLHLIWRNIPIQRILKNHFLLLIRCLFDNPLPLVLDLISFLSLLVLLLYFLTHVKELSFN